MRTSPSPSLKGGALKQAVKILRQGGIVVYPTDTAYGLAVDATNAKAVVKLYRLKGRDFKNPIHVIAPKNWINRIVQTNPTAKKLMDKFWPGPLTIVLPLKAKGKSWRKLSAGTKTLGIRNPKNSITQALGLLKKPITTTSANLSDKPNTYSVAEVKKQFAKASIKPDFYLDGGKLKQRKPSTIVLVEKNRVKILRVGPITERQIKNVLSKTPELFLI